MDWNELEVFGFTCACPFAVQAIWLVILRRLLTPECKTLSVPYDIYAILPLASPGYALWMSVSLMDTALCALWALCFMAQPVLTGGDHFAFHRFYQPVYPLVCVLLALIGARVVARFAVRFNFVWLVAGAVICAFFAFRPSLIDFRNDFYARNEFAIARTGMETGVMLNALYADASQKPRVGVVAAGGIARTYEGVIVDLMGLCDTRIAHFKGNRRGYKNHAAFEPSKFDAFGIDILPMPPNDFMIRALKGMIVGEPFRSTWRYGRLAILMPVGRSMSSQTSCCGMENGQRSL